MRSSSNHDRLQTLGSDHIPERRCIGCGANAPKRDLARFVAVRDADGATLARDDRARHPGRGLYVCPTRTCFERAIERKAFLRAARLGGVPLRIDTNLADVLDG
jgi:predicted RNA-binding protein YlxR (DUF448 family)